MHAMDPTVSPDPVVRGRDDVHPSLRERVERLDRKGDLVSLRVVRHTRRFSEVDHAAVKPHLGRREVVP